jgi:TonB-dependent SusC/RagA subfamily outer membrane receptor
MVHRSNVGLRLLGALLVLGTACQSLGSAPPADRPEDEVNVGYGRQSEREVTGAISSASGEELRDRVEGRLEEVIAARFPGVVVTRMASGDYSIRIRGARSLLANNEPLVVVDGVPLSDGTRALRGIHPGSIERIDVLKDAGSTAIYGSRGANGVILLTTRR